MDKPRGPRYREVMNPREVVRLLENGVYVVGKETGEVRNRRGRVVTPYVGNDEGHLYVRIYDKGPPKKVKTIAVARLVWMSVTLTPIPKGFEVHHRDKVTTSNGWDNLLCVHRKDHHKLHATEPEEPIPF